MTPVTQWTVTAVVRAVDGDTVKLRLARDTGEVPGLVLSARTKNPRGVSARLTWVDTPEESSDPAGWARAAADTGHWLADALQAAVNGLTADVYGEPDAWGRWLLDLYPTGHPEDSLSRWLMTSGDGGRGWPAYVRGK